MIGKDKKSSIGCTIKNVVGEIYIGSVIPGGYVSKTGVLVPDDKIVEINGVKV